jgi:hypothetical protein
MGNSDSPLSYVPSTYPRRSKNRGIGTRPSCPPGKTDIDGLCYDPCDSGYERQSLGLCSQICPAGLHDFGTGCTRQSYTRGAGVAPFKLYFKERKVPFGVKQ